MAAAGLEGTAVTLNIRVFASVFGVIAAESNKESLLPGRQLERSIPAKNRAIHSRSLRICLGPFLLFSELITGFNMNLNIWDRLLLHYSLSELSLPHGGFFLEIDKVFMTLKIITS